MKKVIIMFCLALIAGTTVQAQSGFKNLVKQRKSNNKELKELIDEKVSDQAKTIAKKLKKQGYETMGGDDLAHMVYQQELLEKELMADDDEIQPPYRYIVQTASATAGTYNAAVAAAQAAAKNLISGLIETKLAEAIQTKLGSDQTGAKTSVTLDKFNQRGKSVVQNCLIKMQNPLTIYRNVKDLFEVRVAIAYDKKVIGQQLKDQLKKNLEVEGDKELNGTVDEALKAITNTPQE